MGPASTIGHILFLALGIQGHLDLLDGLGREYADRLLANGRARGHDKPLRWGSPPHERRLRLDIVAVRMADAQPWQRDWMLQHRERWLRDLTVPLSLDLLCHRVKESSPSDKLEIDDLVRECAVDVLAESCMNEVRGRGPGGVSAEIAFWALLQARQYIGGETPAEIFTLRRRRALRLA